MIDFIFTASVCGAGVACGTRPVCQKAIAASIAGKGNRRTYQGGAAVVRYKTSYLCKSLIAFLSEARGEREGEETDLHGIPCSRKALRLIYRAMIYYGSCHFFDFLACAHCGIFLSRSLELAEKIIGAK